MHTKQFLAISGALFALAAAVPLNHKREIIVVTKIEETVVTIPVIRTIWLKAGESAPTAAGVPSTQAAPSATAASSHYKAPMPASIDTAAAHSSIPAPSAAAPSSSVAAVHSPTEAAPAPPPPSTSAVVVATTAAPAPASSAPAPSSPAPAPAPTSPTTPTSSGATTDDAGEADDLTDGPAAAGRSYVGDLTWYSTGLGACGQDSTAADHIVAVAESVFDFYAVGSNPNDNPICNQWVEITGVDGTVYPAQIVDRCTGCSSGSLDLSEDFFNLVTNNGNGRVHDIHWQFAGST